MLEREKTGLILIDVQGKLAQIVHESEAMLKNIEILIQGCKILNIPIVWLEQNPAGLGRTLPQLLEHLSGHHPLEKYTFNACDTPSIVEAITASGVTEWLVCGIETHICVYQTALGLLSRGYKVEVVADCVSSRTEANIKLALKKLRDNGVGLTSLEMCFFEMLKDARQEEFKKLLTLIK